MTARFLLIFSALLFANSCAHTPYTPIDQRPVTAVVPFLYKINKPEYVKIQPYLTQSFTEEITRVNRFRFVDKEQIGMLLTQATLFQRNLWDNALLQELGKKAGADILIVGYIHTIFIRDSAVRTRSNPRIIRQFRMDLELQMMDVPTGEILYSLNLPIKSKLTYRGEQVASLETYAAEDVVLRELIDAACKNMVADLLRHYQASKISRFKKP